MAVKREAMTNAGAAQANLFCYPVGSGEFWELRESNLGDAKRPFTPRQRADRPLGQWNQMEITVKGDRLWVKLNGEQVIENAQLPGLPERGPLALQHHGSKRNGQWTSPPALVQFRNISIKEL